MTSASAAVHRSQLALIEFQVRRARCFDGGVQGERWRTQVMQDLVHPVSDIANHPAEAIKW